MISQKMIVLGEKTLQKPDFPGTSLGGIQKQEHVKGYQQRQLRWFP